MALSTTSGHREGLGALAGHACDHVPLYLRGVQACGGIGPQSSTIAAWRPSTAPGSAPAASPGSAPEHMTRQCLLGIVATVDGVTMVQNSATAAIAGPAP